jgi:hypothetical protein
VDEELHRVGHRQGFRLVTDSASSLSIGTGLASTTVLPIFTLPRFWSCYCSPRGFPLKVRPFALKGKRFQPFSAQQKFNEPLVGARFNSFHTTDLVNDPKTEPLLP